VKHLKSISAVFLAVLLATVLGCAPSPTRQASGECASPLLTQHYCSTTASRETMGEYVDDAVITTKVKAAIFKEASLKSSEINVETFRGTVQLSGFVKFQADIDRAGDVARGVGGVKSVSNDMRLK